MFPVKFCSALTLVVLSLWIKQNVSEELVMLFMRERSLQNVDH